MQLNSTLLDDLNYNLSKTKIDKRYIWIEGLYNALRYRTPAEIAFDELQGPTVDMLLSQDEIEEINRLLVEKKSWNHGKKFQILDAIFKPKGYKRGDCGTNRVVYIPFWNDKFVVKVALDSAARKNMPDELVNQKYLKPFVSKCFDIDTHGNIGVYERVIPIRNLDQFWGIRDDVYNIIQSLIKRFVIDDFGTNAFMNWGVREGFGPVLLDYADMYLIDPETLYCKAPEDWRGRTVTKYCGGRIGYTAGYNSLICLDCGRPAKAAEFKGRPKMAIRSPKRREKIMKFKIYEGNDIVFDPENGIDKIHQQISTKTRDQYQLEEVVKSTNEAIRKVNDAEKKEVQEIKNKTGLELNLNNRIEPIDTVKIINRAKHSSFLSRNEAAMKDYENNREKIRKEYTAATTTVTVKPKKRRRILVMDDPKETKPIAENETTVAVIPKPKETEDKVIVSKPKRRRILVLDDEHRKSKVEEKEVVVDHPIENISIQSPTEEIITSNVDKNPFTEKVEEPVTIEASAEVESETNENTDVKEQKEKIIMNDKNIEALKTIINNGIDAVNFEQTKGTPFSMEELKKFFKVLDVVPDFSSDTVRLVDIIPEPFLCDAENNIGELAEENIDMLFITKKQYDEIKPYIDNLYNTLNDIKIGIEEEMYGSSEIDNFEAIRRNSRHYE